MSEPQDAGSGEIKAVAPAAMTLGRHAARGASVVVSGQVGRMVIQVLSVVILARLLTPQDYGLVAIVLAIVGVGEIVRDFGLSTAAVQAKHLSLEQRNKLFWVNTAIGAGLTVVGMASAPLVARAFGQPELSGVMLALSVTFLLNGMAAQYRAHLNRAMKWGALVVADLAPQVIGIAGAVVFAVAGAGYWALVAQQIIQAVATLIMMASVTRWVPGPWRRGVDIRSMARFGHGLMASQFIGYLNSNVDTFTIAWKFGPSALGIYNRGFQLVMRPLNQLRGPTTTVALPVLSKLHDDPDRAARYIIKGQLALGYPLVGGLAFAAGACVPIVHLLLGSAWDEVGPIFGVLAIAGAFQTLAYVGSWVYLARGLTGKLFWYSLISLAIKVICVLVGSMWGVLGVAVGFAVAPALTWPISLWWLARLTPFPVRALTLGALRIVACALPAGLASLAVVLSTTALPAVVQIFLALVASAGVYALAAVVSMKVRADVVEVHGVLQKVLRR